MKKAKYKITIVLMTIALIIATNSHEGLSQDPSEFFCKTSKPWISGECPDGITIECCILFVDGQPVLIRKRFPE